MTTNTNTNINTGGPAYPVPMIPTGAGAGGFTDIQTPGKTLLDWFAGQEQPILENNSWIGPAVMGRNPPMWGGDNEANLEYLKWWSEADARYRYLRAKAMLVERQRRLKEEEDNSFSWKPIATAPKDGTEVILCLEDNTLVHIACWRNGAWHEWGLHFDRMAWVAFPGPRPTHWLKLEPPKNAPGGVV